MVTVCSSEFCTGCGACQSVCPVEAITLKLSIDKYEANINEEKCIRCNRCSTVCPNINQPVKSSPLSVQQGWAKNTNVRQHSSSGGVATALSLFFLENIGSVFCCSYADNKYEIKECKTKDEILHSAGSKYVKSEISTQYKSIADLLKSNHKVLIIALPCQIAALKNYVGEKLQENLFTIDLICHGTPKYELLDSYLRELKVDSTDYSELQFREKENFSLKINEKYIKAKKVRDRYMAAFLNGATYTENCYSCKYASLDRVTDITLGDSWGSELSDDEKKRGISLILCQTLKGRMLLDKAGIELYNVNKDIAVKNNKQLSAPSVMPAERQKFFVSYEHNKSFSKAFFKAYPKQAIKAKIKEIVYRFI